MENKTRRNYLKISFWVMVCSWFTSTFLIPLEYMTPIDYLWIISIISTFVLSIITLIKEKNKPKGFVITSLVISSIWLLFLLIGIGITIMLGE